MGNFKNIKTEMVLLFVYGSLQKGLWNNYWLDGSTFISLAKTVNKFSLKTQNHVIPKVCPNERQCQICGELYDVPAEELKKIDDHEGVGIYYQRKGVDVKDNTGKVYRVSIYFNENSESGDVNIPDGNYKDYIIKVAGDKNFVDVLTVQKYNDY